VKSLLACILSVPLLLSAVACWPGTGPALELRSPSGEYRVTIHGLRGRALTPAFTHDVTAYVTRAGADHPIKVWLSIEDLFDQPFESQFASAFWPAPNLLVFRGSLSEQPSSDELVIQNTTDRVVPCLKIYTIANYDLVVALDIKGKSRIGVEWKPKPFSKYSDDKAHFMAAVCDTPGRSPTVYKIFPLTTDRQVYAVTVAETGITLGVAPVEKGPKKQL
jgi:hypothetical protein